MHLGRYQGNDIFAVFFRSFRTDHAHNREADSWREKKSQIYSTELRESSKLRLSKHYFDHFERGEKMKTHFKLTKLVSLFLTIMMVVTMAVPAVFVQADTVYGTEDLTYTLTIEFPFAFPQTAQPQNGMGMDSPMYDGMPSPLAVTQAPVYRAYQLFEYKVIDTGAEKQGAVIGWGSDFKDPTDGDPTYGARAKELVRILSSETALKEALGEDYPLPADLAFLDSGASVDNAWEKIVEHLIDHHEADKGTVEENNAWMEAFAKCVDYVVAKDYDGDPASYAGGTAVTINNDDPPTGTANLHPGYYLVTNTVSFGPGVTVDPDVSSLILDSVIVDMTGGDVNIKFKVDEPTVEKKITTKGTPLSADGAGIGDYVQFTLTGTISSYYDTFDKYYYAFVDTLSPGLTFATDHQLKVTVYLDGDPNNHDDGNAVEIGEASGTTDSTYDGYILEGPSSVSAPGTSYGEGSHRFTLKFNDLKKLTKSGGSVAITEKSVIVVTYWAYVNQDAQILTGSNPNEVYLQYSNNPNGDGYGESEPDDAVVYTTGVALTKFDGSDKGSGRAVLADAGFVLMRKNPDPDPSKLGTNQVAVFKGTTPRTGGKIVAWIDVPDDLLNDDAKLKTLNAENYPDAESQITAALTAAGENTDSFSLDNYYVECETGTDGILNFNGLGTYTETTSGPTSNQIITGSVTYTLRETTVPVYVGDVAHQDSYVKMEDINFTITSTVNEKGTGEDWSTGSFTASLPGAARDDVELNGNTSVSFPAGGAGGTFALYAVNYLESDLPETGGTGTTMFYVAGGAMLILAAGAMALVLRKKKN